MKLLAHILLALELLQYNTISAHPVSLSKPLLKREPLEFNGKSKNHWLKRRAPMESAGGRLQEGTSNLGKNLDLVDPEATSGETQVSRSASDENSACIYPEEKIIHEVQEGNAHPKSGTSAETHQEEYNKIVGKEIQSGSSRIDTSGSPNQSEDHVDHGEDSEESTEVFIGRPGDFGKDAPPKDIFLGRPRDATTIPLKKNKKPSQELKRHHILSLWDQGLYREIFEYLMKRWKSRQQENKTYLRMKKELAVRYVSERLATAAFKLAPKTGYSSIGEHLEHELDVRRARLEQAMIHIERLKSSPSWIERHAK
ncbi:hypothetical protein PGT21_014050 [Puccinia graminis f. sp. tritici]|uniref:Uncharacterized protein n=1 Tax=Puccinia graminis f. sp. tritici TaxID=56615 RepID=A0A5B0Q693_PUCGR|nr:hypothetical protein PGT21_014050 [Puccinia graminis f. sp. tritici]